MLKMECGIVAIRGFVLFILFYFIFGIVCSLQFNKLVCNYKKIAIIYDGK